jgi:NADH-quinone oxidoreductase subunit M
MNETTLSLLLLIPLVGALVLLFLPFNTTKQIILGKQIALITSVAAFLESIRLWMLFDSSTSAFQFTIRVALGPNAGLGSWSFSSGPSGAQELATLSGGLVERVCAFGIDGISIYFVLLTTLLIPICILASWDSIKSMVKTYLLCFLILEELLLGVFTVLDLLGFYVLFEGVLIPMFLIIGIWGAREQKITAAYYFFFYTLVGSVLMLLSIFYIYNESGTTDYLTLLAWLADPAKAFDPDVQKIIFLAFFASLAVKIPKVPFHIWLPLAHVEAPLAGSVILAGVLIKLGSYGFIRFTLPLLPDASVYFTPLVFTLATLAVIYASLTTLRQTDLKRIIAYSSVSHMGVVMLGLW